MLAPWEPTTPSEAAFEKGIRVITLAQGGLCPRGPRVGPPGERPGKRAGRAAPPDLTWLLVAHRKASPAAPAAFPQHPAESAGGAHDPRLTQPPGALRSLGNRPSAAEFGGPQTLGPGPRGRYRRFPLHQGPEPARPPSLLCPWSPGPRSRPPWPWRPEPFATALRNTEPRLLRCSEALMGFVWGKETAREGVLGPGAASGRRRAAAAASTLTSPGFCLGGTPGTQLQRRPGADAGATQAARPGSPPGEVGSLRRRQLGHQKAARLSSRLANAGAWTLLQVRALGVTESCTGRDPTPQCERKACGPRAAWQGPVGAESSLASPGPQASITEGQPSPRPLQASRGQNKVKFCFVILDLTPSPPPPLPCEDGNTGGPLLCVIFTF